MQKGLVFNIQKFSLQDGPGIRTTVFLKGCPLCCPWCHNPEGISPQRELVVTENRCIACGKCREACAFASSLPGEGPLPARHESCTLCASCVEACPTGAREIVGQEMTVEQVLREVVQDRIFYDDSTGGVTFSGGEPLLQPEFLRALLDKCQGYGLHTAVDTCGFACVDDLLAIAPLTSLFLYDLKLINEAKHRQYTGVSNRPILENLKALDQVHDNIWIRVPLIPGINDAPEDLEAVAQFAASIHGVRQVNLLPYHKFGLQKFPRLGHTCLLSSLKAPSAERLEAALSAFRSRGLATSAGG
jgi:pyruvate formate lyase activating enzyme